MKFGFLILIFIAFNTMLSISTSAQITPNKTAEEQKYFDELNKKWNNALGTFQIQVVNSRINPQVGVEVIEKVEQSRKENEIVYIAIRENVRIMVLPYSEILKKDFVKVPHFKYISE